MPPFVALQVNPNPSTHTTDRQWAALHPSGIIMVSHGLQVPQDTPGQMERRGGLIGSWAQPRWGWPGASRQDYPADVGRDLIVTDWTPDDLKGYVMDTFGSIWPFGTDTPYAAVGPTGAPFGSEPPSPLPIYNAFQMDSGNGKQFGMGGIPTGWGHLLSYYGTVYEWGGPGPVLTAPNLQLSFLTTITNPEMIQDFKLDWATSHYYVLFASGFVFAGAAVNESPMVVNGAQPHGHSGNDPGGSDYLTALDADHRRWFKSMHVEFNDSIIAARINGELWGHALLGGQAAPGAPAPPPWITSTPYGWPDIAIRPYRSPTHFYLLSWSGGIFSDVVSGTVTVSGLTTSGSHTTTTTPSLNWTYTAQYGVTQKAFQVRVYRQSYIDAQGGAFVAGQLAGTDDGWLDDRETAVASDKINRNLNNGVAYRAYVRVQSAADVWSSWVNLAFTMAVSVPGQPSSCTATPIVGTYPGLGTVNISAGGGLGGGELRQFQVSTAGNAFVDVWNAEATSSATVSDPWPPTQVPLTYRVRTFKRVPGIVASAWRTASPVTLASATGTPTGYRFIDVGPGGAGPVVILPLEVADAGTIASASFERVEERGEFQTFGQAAKTVTSAGVKGDDHAITLKSLDGTQYAALYKMLSLTRPVLYQNGFHRQWWVRPTPGTWKTLQMGAMAGETSGIRDAHDITLRLVEVNPPR